MGGTSKVNKHSYTHPLTPSAARAITFGWQQRLPVLTTPANGVNFACGQVTPEVLGTILVVTLIAQPQQWAASDDDGGHPVGTRGRFVGHLHSHPFDKATLQAAFHLSSENQHRVSSCKTGFKET